MQEFSMVGGYTENLEKPQNCQNWGVGACSGQYGDYMRPNTMSSRIISGVLFGCLVVCLRVKYNCDKMYTGVL